MKYILIPAIVILLSGCTANEYKKSMAIVTGLLAASHDYRDTSFCRNKNLTLIVLKDSLIASAFGKKSSVYGHRSEIYYYEGKLAALRTIKVKIVPSTINIETFNEIFTIDTTASFYFDISKATMQSKDFLQLIDGC